MPGELRGEFAKDARRMKQELARNFVASIGGMEEESTKDGGKKDLSTGNLQLKDVPALFGGMKNVYTENGGSMDVAALVGGTEREGLEDVTEEDEVILYSFERAEMYKFELAGTVIPYPRHFFLCHWTGSWPAQLDEESACQLPKLFTREHKRALGKASKPLQSRLTICQQNEDARFSNGDVLVFPDMHVYRRLRLKPPEVREFVEQVMVRGERWLSTGSLEVLTGSYIFVCVHKLRDRRCGSCGPPLIKEFNQVIEAKDLKHKVFVTGCTHIGGINNSCCFAGNVIIFSRDSKGKVAGNWYGYVTPEDVHELVEKEILKGEVVERLWRGQLDATSGNSLVSLYDDRSPVPITVRAKAEAEAKAKRDAAWAVARVIMLGMASAAAATIAAYGIYRRRRIR
ncbi:altered inheritance of mitochondria protein 32-like isoform X2 [Andrographis paniculata]|uniref:altered inheritance of mitochondria protein 32-like isoform X2 n=1 Tax=Andrographis paniculata TaxID=175694 RepID=UPI0021E76C2C|nr:altered inheritance of mitochondria protein 32-like isoform X2 [Andrographis paniculata]